MILSTIVKKIQLWYLEYPFLKWILLAFIGIIIILCIKWRLDYRIYSYIDLNDNYGVASYCWEEQGNLICNKIYNGKIQVKEYIRVR